MKKFVMSYNHIITATSNGNNNLFHWLESCLQENGLKIFIIIQDI